MRNHFWRALILVTGLAGAWHVQSQTIYRCGNSYSQAPCPGAVTMDLSDLSDTRLKEQREQTQAAAQNDARLADKLEQERLAEEKRQLANNLPDATNTPPNSSVKALDQIPKRKPKRNRSKRKKATTLPATAQMDNVTSLAQ